VRGGGGISLTQSQQKERVERASGWILNTFINTFRCLVCLFILFLSHLIHFFHLIFPVSFLSAHGIYFISSTMRFLLREQFK
jgi:hypothetical protein